MVASNNNNIMKVMEIDPAWGSIAFGIVITGLVDGIIQVVYAEEYLSPDYNEMLHAVVELIQKYKIDKTYIDAANPSFIRSLKMQLGI
jgi:hypothetical protein